MTDVTVDLKWSLWSRDRETWDERANGIWELLASTPVGTEIYIRSAPKKEIRFGDVILLHVAENSWTAHVNFRAEWDNEPPIVVIGEVGPKPTFAEIMADIDEVEDDLIREGKR